MNELISPLETDLLYSRKVLEMITVANEYCLFLEKADKYTLDELLSFVQKIIPLIYLKSALLPDTEVSDEDAVEHYVTEEQWETMFNMLHTAFGSADGFYYIDLNEKSHTDPVKGSLAECFTDTYQDLKDFLMLYQNPVRTFKENAVKECKRLFETRYGTRLINAHAAVHAIIYPAGDSEIIF
ncbi:MAG: DUF5063 domain-containing protein [Bacteroidetes bacterium]|nr:DUF5063 domain-containing protein [Bacteroidota bacterium]